MKVLLQGFDDAAGVGGFLLGLAKDVRKQDFAHSILTLLRQLLLDHEAEQTRPRDEVSKLFQQLLATWI